MFDIHSGTRTHRFVRPVMHFKQGISVVFGRFQASILYSFFMLRITILTTLFAMILCTQQRAQAQSLTDDTQIEITKVWSQQPGGWTYPISISMPDGPAPNGGHPVCILLHGNGGNGQGTIPQFRSLLPCHALVAPSGYQSSWDICNEQSEAPDVEMVGELIAQLQAFTNVDSGRIRILGFSNGFRAGESSLHRERQSRPRCRCARWSPNSPKGSTTTVHFIVPAGITTPGAAYCGYDTPKTPIAGRRYLSICNFNDFVIPTTTGENPVSVPPS